MVAILCACGAGLVIEGRRAAVGAASSADPAPIPWLPGESYADGPTFDPRLDRPVRFWGAGLSLRDVFAEVRQQTGVEVGFWPPGGANERVRVNLYLSPEDPPTLRALMSQLWWATDCAFGYRAGADETAPYRYYLLSTSIAGGAQARLEQEWQQAMAGLREEWETRAPSRDDVAARLADHGRALLLTRDELIDRYYGVDDRLLANMLDPGRRATVDFVLGLGGESIGALLEGERLTLDWRDLSRAQQDDLRSCLRAPPRRGRGGPWGSPGPDAGEEGWGDQEVTQVHVGGLNYGQVMLVGETDTPDAESRGPWGRSLWAPMIDLAGRGELRPDEAMALRRALGEEVTDEEARSLFGEWFESQRDEMRQQWESRTQDAIDAAAAEALPLSPGVEAVLSSFIVPLEPEASYALWQIQEVVASTTGMNVVSDCFFQPRQDLSEALRRLYPGEEVENTGLRVLRASTLTTEDLPGLVWAIPGDHRAGWEWQDAGSFLRFRSKARDLWRASMLPPEAQARLDGWLDAYMPAPDRERPATPLDVTLDPQQISLTAAGLSDLQLEHGGKLTCGDPAEKAAAYRQALRQEVLGAMSRASYPLRALATLSDPQWEQLRGPGLRVRYDLTPEQKAAFGLSPEEAEREATGPSPGRRGRRGESLRGGRRAGGPMLGRAGRGGPGGGRFPLPDEEAMGRLVIRLLDERPPRPGEERRRRPGEERPRRPGEERSARPDEERPGRGRPGEERRGGPGEDRDRPGWGRWLAKESSYLTFWLDEQPQGMYPVPRVVSVDMVPPTPLGRPIPLEPS